MDRQTLYEIYQENLELLESELEQVKKMTQINLGKYYYEKNTMNNSGVIGRLESEILASTRLYTFLLCSWFEVRLHKILYESSSVAFSDNERNIVTSARTMSDRWKNCLNMSICKSYGFVFCPSQGNYSSCFAVNSEHLVYYQQVYNYLDDIEHAITIRNKLAHGQWKIPLNSDRTNYAGSVVDTFLNDYDNIQKLDLLYNMYKIIAEIISSYVVYKDKTLTNNFKSDLKKKIEKVENLRTRIKKASFDSYCQAFQNKERMIRAANKKFYE